MYLLILHFKKVKMSASNSHITENQIRTLARFCTYQERCIQEVLQKMKVIGVFEEDQPKILEQLIQEGFIDEQRYASAYVRGKLNINQWGKIKIKAMLSQKGIPSSIIQAALSEIDMEEYHLLIEKLAKKHSPKIKAKNDYERKQKLLYFLQSRGFEADILYQLKL